MVESPNPSPGVKVHYLVRRAPGVSREEFVASWFTHHMPRIIEQRRKSTTLNTSGYVVSLFDEENADHGSQPIDGVAVFWINRELTRPAAEGTFDPADAFEEMAEPYWAWQTEEFLVMDPSTKLPLGRAPFPCKRSGFHRVSQLMTVDGDVNGPDLREYWLEKRVPEVRSRLENFGAFGFVVNISLYAEDTEYAGLEEYYFPDDTAWREYKLKEDLGRDGFFSGSSLYTTNTEFVGIPRH